MKIIEINLLPPEEAPESPYSIRNVAILVISFVIAIWLILLALQMNNLKDGYAQRMKELWQQLAVYKIQKQKIDKLQKKKADLEQRYKLITELLVSRITWYDKLNVMHRQIPENVWLSQVSMKIQQAVPTSPLPVQGRQTGKDLEKSGQQLILFHILGYTTELPKIGELIDNLDNSQFFEKTKFESIENTTINGRSVISFEIITQLTQKRVVINK